MSTSTTSRIGETATAAADAVKDQAAYVKDQAAQATDRIRDEYASTERRAREIVEEYPLTCFFGAVIAGYLIGRIASRI
jgi:hypothetical protein